MILGKSSWQSLYELQRIRDRGIIEMEVFCRMCGVSSDQSIVIMRADLGDVLCQSCYEKRLDEWARS